MAVAFRRPGPADDPAIERARALANGGPPDPGGPTPLVAALREHDRSLVGLDGDEVVATSLGHRFRLSLPGEGVTAEAAGLAGIAVVPTHRRRGLLREMMRANLDGALDRGEVLAVLWPSESPIYRRFGFGPATTTVSWEIEQHRTAMVAVDGLAGRAVRTLAPDPAVVAAAVAPVHDAVRHSRPGMVDRTAPWWAYRTANAATSHVWVVAEGTSGPEGYASYQVEATWGADGPDNTLHVGEVAATTLEAEVALWEHLFGIDLVRRVTAWGRPPDDALLRLVADSRKLRQRLGDGAWLRLVDVGAALAARRYRTEIDSVLGVSDSFCPWNAGAWHLEAEADRPACCTPTDRRPDLVLDVADLARAYLGGTGVRTLQRAGLAVEHTPGTAERADLAFSWSPAPWAVTWF